MNSALSEIFVETEDSRRTGFTFLHDRKAVLNYIHPECLDYFLIFAEHREYKGNEEDAFPEGIMTSDKCMGKRWASIVKDRRYVKCYDGKCRRCDIVSFRVVVDGRNYDELFVVDKSLRVAGGVFGKNVKL